MGTTIGINTTILLASLLYIAGRVYPLVRNGFVIIGFKIFNVSLLLFWITLLAAGIKKSVWQYFSDEVSFGLLQSQLHWVYVAFVVFGAGIFIGTLLIAIQLLKAFTFAIRGKLH
jgi:nitric oxide reductase subunit B